MSLSSTARPSGSSSMYSRSADVPGRCGLVDDVVSGGSVVVVHAGGAVGAGGQ